MPQSLDAPAVRAWCQLALAELGRAREEIDAVNVYPVADGDTGTNLYLTVESAAQAVEAVFDGHAAAPAGRPDLAEAVRAMAHGALIGARGNSGTILAQLLRGMGEVLADHGHGDDPADPADAAVLRRALRRAAALTYQAVVHPVEGTMLTVAAAAADAAEGAGDDPGTVALAAYDAARRALATTPGQLDALARAGVVDAGGLGLVVVLGALADAVHGGGRTQIPSGYRDPALMKQAPVAAGPAPGCPPKGSDPRATAGGPAYEVVYLLEAPDDAVPALRDRLDAIGNSLVVVGGDGLWNVHVHVDDAGAAVEAGIEAGRPYRIRITHFGEATWAAAEPAPEPVRRAVVAILPGRGLADLCERAGATVVTAGPGEPVLSGRIAEAIRRTGAREVVLLPNDPELWHAAGAAAEQARAEGVRVAPIPTRSPVQGIAALAVHEPSRRFDEDVVAMTSAAGATRYGELAVAERESWTTVGVCQAGDVLGVIDGDVAVIGADLAQTAAVVVDRMLSAGGEMVTLVVGDGAPRGLAERLQAHVRERYLAVDTVVYGGGAEQASPLVVGVE